MAGGVSRKPRGKPARKVTTLRSRKVLFTAVKNEAPFLLEWIAYHLEVGFDRIIIFSNESEDGTTELLDALAQSGVIEHFYHEPAQGVSAQANAARLANEKELLQHGDWVLWIDADEFLNIKIGSGTLDELIDKIGDKHGMFINWRVFGDSGNQFFPGRFISSDFVGAAQLNFVRHLEIKTLFRHGPDFSGLATYVLNRPSMKKGRNVGLECFLNGNGVVPEDSVSHQRWLAGEEHWHNCQLQASDLGGQVAQINHYSIRTPELYEMKRMRGRGLVAQQSGAANRRHTELFYRRMNRNGRADNSILRFASVVTRRMAELGALPGVYEALNHAERLTAISIAHNERPDTKPKLSDVLSTASTEPPKVTLPDKEHALVEKCYRDARFILEYGSGGSTVIALETGAEWVFSVESDPVWTMNISTVLQRNYPDANFSIHYVDIGPTKEWGWPQSNTRQKVFHRYATSVWDIPHFVEPDVVLIDGRFRTACFCTTVMKSKRPKTVLFDDYVDRPEYHWIEDILPVSEIVGRMARFDLKESIDVTPHLTKIAGSFVDAR